MKTYDEVVKMAAKMVIRDHRNGINSSHNVEQSVPVFVLMNVCEVSEDKFVDDVMICIVSGEVDK